MRKMLQSTVKIPINYEMGTAYGILQDYFEKHSYINEMNLKGEEVIIKHSNFAGFATSWSFIVRHGPKKMIIESYVDASDSAKSFLGGVFYFIAKRKARSVLNNIRKLLMNYG